VTSLRDRLKLYHLQSKEKYIVTVSQSTGKTYFHRVTDSDDKDLLDASTIEAIHKNETLKLKQETKEYSSQESSLKHPRAYESWSEMEDKELISQYLEKLPIREIARKHQRKISAIKSRLSKLERYGLIRR
jgi:DNA-directed RNA polymerase specialized sigma24 family protein